MKIEKPDVDYRNFRWNKRNTEEFSHLKLLLYWPLFGMAFLFVERVYQVEFYYPMHCRLDDYIPFQEWFLIPYMFWFLFLVGIHIYTLLYDVESFRKLMKFIMITYSTAILVYLIFPNCQELRPVVFERDNFLTEFMKGFYQFDTNTNVCPSIHVIGSLAVMFTAWHSKHFCTPKWKFVFGFIAILISISTVFLKQHSVLDILAALPVSLTAYYICYYRKKYNNKNLTIQEEFRGGQNESETL